MPDAAQLAPLEVYHRGLNDPDTLSAEERLVYLVLELETYADMEGWDHFFTTPLLRFYEELKRGLREAGALASLQVLERYEAFLRTHGVVMDPDAIEVFCAEFEGEAPDWREEFSHLVEARWEEIRSWLNQRGVTLAD